MDTVLILIIIGNEHKEKTKCLNNKEAKGNTEVTVCKKKSERNKYKGIACNECAEVN